MIAKCRCTCARQISSGCRNAHANPRLLHVLIFMETHLVCHSQVFRKLRRRWTNLCIHDPAMVTFFLRCPFISNEGKYSMLGISDRGIYCSLLRLYMHNLRTRAVVSVCDAWGSRLLRPWCRGTAWITLRCVVLLLGVLLKRILLRILLLGELTWSERLMGLLLLRRRRSCPSGRWLVTLLPLLPLLPLLRLLVVLRRIVLLLVSIRHLLHRWLPAWWWSLTWRTVVRWLWLLRSWSPSRRQVRSAVASNTCILGRVTMAETILEPQADMLAEAHLSPLLFQLRTMLLVGRAFPAETEERPQGDGYQSKGTPRRAKRPFMRRLNQK